MSRLLLINRRPDQRRVALIENGLTTELFFERIHGRGPVGNVYKGRVVRVLPGMQCAFVEVGLARTAFLYVGDVYDGEVAESSGGGRGHKYPPIKTLVREGQELLVQVAKEPMGTKGARVTTHLSLPGRLLVYRPTVSQVGVSRRIEEPGERERLRTLAEQIKPEVGGLIVRTVGEHASEDELRADLEFLLVLWSDLHLRAGRESAPSLVHEDLDIALRSVRDLMGSELDRVLIDDPTEQERVAQFTERFMPDFSGAVELWQAPDPLFERFGLEWEISRAVRRKVWLRSGGYLAIDPTEALTAIDVNTGRNVGKSNFEETVLENNLEATKEIAYQLRFRDIGGLIVIDFIDMASPANRERVRDSLIEALSSDKARTHVLPMSELGLIEMTRKRVRESIVQSLTEPCFYCEGRGYLRSVQVTVDSIISRLRQFMARGASGELRVLAHPRVVEPLVEECGDLLAGFEREHGVAIQVIPREDMHLEEVEIV